MSTLTAIPFYTDTIEIGHVISASDPYLFTLQGRQLRDFIQEDRCSLAEYDDRQNHLLAEKPNGEFIEFFERTGRS